MSRLAAKLAPQLATLDDDPKDLSGFLVNTDRFVEILKHADISHCPEDFRTQYITSLNAWAAHAQNLRLEDAYLKGHPDENQDVGVRKSLEEAQLMLNAYESNESALRENDKLSSLALSYGVQWP